MHKRKDPYYSSLQMDPAYPVTLINIDAATTAGGSSTSRHRATATATKRTKPPTTWANISAAVLESLRDLHLVLSLTGTIDHVSPNSAALLGYAPQQLVGTVLVDLVHDDDAPVYRDELREASSTGRPFRFYCRIRSCNDSTNAGGTVLSAKQDEVSPSSPSPPSSPVQQYSVFEIHGRFHPPSTPRPVPAGIGLVAIPPSNAGVFVLMARPQPLSQSSKLDSFLWLKMENARLTQQLAELKAEQQRDGDAITDYDANNDAHPEQQNPQQPSTSPLSSLSLSSTMPAPSSTSTFRRMSAAEEGFPWLDYTPSMTLSTGSASSSSAQTTADSLFSSASSSLFGPASSSNSSINTTASTPLSPFSSMVAAAAATAGRGRKLSNTGTTAAAPVQLATVPGIGTGTTSISAVTASPTNTPTVMEGDVGIPFIVKALTGAGGIKKRAKHVEDYVCAWCSAVNSPEWRKGPAGPKTLCNACGCEHNHPFLLLSPLFFLLPLLPHPSSFPPSLSLH